MAEPMALMAVNLPTLCVSTAGIPPSALAGTIREKEKLEPPYTCSAEMIGDPHMAPEGGGMCELQAGTQMCTSQTIPSFRKLNIGERFY